MMSKSNKKGKHIQLGNQNIRREQCEHEVFKLQYLSQTINHIAPDRSLQYFLDIDSNIFDKIIYGDLNNIGLNFIDKMKSMKQRCDDNIYIKDLQQSGDFINYDYPKEYKVNILSIEAQLKQEQQKRIAIKRIREQFPQAAHSMTSSDVEIWNKKYNDSVLESFITNNLMVPEEEQENLTRHHLYRQMFKIPQTQIKQENRQVESLSQQDKIVIVKRQIIESCGITEKLHSIENQTKQKKEEKIEKTRKIIKLSKRTQTKQNCNEEYVPPAMVKINIPFQSSILDSIKRTKINDHQIQTQKVIKVETPKEEKQMDKKMMEEKNQSQCKNQFKISDNISSSELTIGKRKYIKKQKQEKQKGKIEKKHKQKDKKDVKEEKKQLDKIIRENILPEQELRQIMVIPSNVKHVSIGIQTAIDQGQERLPQQQHQQISKQKSNAESLARNNQKLQQIKEQQPIIQVVDHQNQQDQQERRQSMQVMNMMHFPLNIPANRNLLSLPNIYVPNIDNNNIDVPISSNGNDDDIDVGEYLNSD